MTKKIKFMFQNENAFIIVIIIAISFVGVVFIGSMIWSMNAIKKDSYNYVIEDIKRIAGPDLFKINGSFQGLNGEIKDDAFKKGDSIVKIKQSPIIKIYRKVGNKYRYHSKTEVSYSIALENSLHIFGGIILLVVILYLKKGRNNNY